MNRSCNAFLLQLMSPLCLGRVGKPTGLYARARRAKVPAFGNDPLAQGKTKGHRAHSMGLARALGCSRLPSLPRFACADRVIPDGCDRQERRGLVRAGR